MFMTRNFPDLVEYSRPELAFPPLAVNCSPSRTASAIITADSSWRCLLDHEHLSLLRHLGSLTDLAREFISIDSALAGTLDRTW